MNHVSTHDVPCSVCDRQMHGIIGIQITLLGRPETMKLAYPELPNGFSVSICYVCWLESLGVNINHTGEIA